MQVDDCPLPEVTAALGPFIRPRDEVVAIREGLQNYLQKQLRSNDDETTLSSVSLTIAADEDLEDPPGPLTGVRKAYWKALQANRLAQARYDALKDDLAAFKRTSQLSDTPASYINETYIPLLRQREKLRRLKVLDRAYGSLPALPSDSLDEQLKSQLGAQPSPPSTHPPSSRPHASAEIETKLLSLKKAVLTTQRRVQDQETRNAVTRASLASNRDLPTGAKIAGLQRALQELTGWMEDQLGVIAEAEAEGSVPSTPDGHSGKATESGVDLHEVETAYDRYLQSRRRLLSTIASPSSSSSPGADTEPLFPPPISPSKPTTNPTTTPSSSLLLLPHIPHLTALATRETALLHQKAYTRRLLQTSEAEAARAMRRLAGESHLVEPGASRGVEWFKTGVDAVRETEEVVRERVERGGEWCARAGEAVRGMEAMKGGE